MVTYKSVRKRAVVVDGKLTITHDEGITLDKHDSLLDKLVDEGFLMVFEAKVIDKK